MVIGAHGSAHHHQPVETSSVGKVFVRKETGAGKFKTFRFGPLLNGAEPFEWNVL